MSKIIVILIFVIAQIIFASNDEKMFGTNEIGTNPPSESSFWTYVGKTEWKINEETILEMETYCMEPYDSDILKKRCVMNNKKNKSIRDSIVYKDGYWELIEEIYKGAFIAEKNFYSTGVSYTTRYDNLGRIQSTAIITEKDTSASDYYIWGEKGRLVKTIFKGKVRNFIYGSPCDSVIVEPADLAIGSFGSYIEYNKSFGKIPEEEDDREYRKFKMSPYQYYAPPELLERQKQRCEEYKETQKKKGKK